MSFWENFKLICICIGAVLLILSALVVAGFIIVAIATFFPWWLTVPVGIIALIFLLTALITWVQTW